MSAPTVDIDKVLSGCAASFGTIDLRVVVLKTRTEIAQQNAAESPVEDDEPVLDDDADPVESASDSPLATYLERKKYGKQCIVFLVNGQRHDALDNTFISRSLGFKYLRNRTMIVVELDRLAPEAVAEAVQGSRQGLYKGRVLDAIKERIIAALKKDPDLVRLQQEAERRVSELNSGDQVVREKLDKLIDSHHSAAQRQNIGEILPGASAAQTHVSFGAPRAATVVVHAPPSIGQAATLPVLDSNCAPTIRLVPDLSRAIRVVSIPADAWASVESTHVRVEPAVGELEIGQHSIDGGLELRLRFDEPEDFDEEAFPIETTLRVFAKFRGHPEVRQLERNIVVARGGVPPPPRKPVALKSTPTFLKVSSRQPVRLIAGGPSTHVKLRWDGSDGLATGASPTWTFTGQCTSLSTFPKIHFSVPRDGRLEALVDAPHGLLPDQPLEFEVVASGPKGASLRAIFKGLVVSATPKDEARSIKGTPPEPTAIRKPPYELKTVKREDWTETPCPWGERPWTKDDPGSFEEPTESAPLILIVNEDAEELGRFREAMVQRNLDESTVRERLSRYQTHVAFHLYQMYLDYKRCSESAPAGADDSEIESRLPSDDDLQAEIRRVASTLIKVMEVSAR